MNNEDKRVADPENKYVEASYELAIYRLLQEESNWIKEHTDEEAEHRIMLLAENHRDEYLKKIETQVKKCNRRIYLFKVGRMMLSILVMTVLIVNFLLTIAVATNNTLRVEAIRFLASNHQSYMEIKYEEYGSGMDIPSDWEEDYFPAFIPAGYKMTSYIPDKDFALIRYEKENSDYLKVDIMGIHTVEHINTENAIVEYITIQNFIATAITQPYNEFVIIWSMGDRYFEVSGNHRDEVISVAESMSLIRNKNNSKLQHFLPAARIQYERRSEK